MAIDASNVWQLTDALSAKPDNKTNTRLATVSRIDDEGHVWVSIPGGETETPTETTDVEVARGDTVTVEWRNNKLYVLGNSTQPATSSRRVATMLEPIEDVANAAYDGVGAAIGASQAAKQASQEAQDTAEAINQHFWHRSTDPDQDGAGTGAFVTDEEQTTFLEAIASGVAPTIARPLHNLLMNAEGILLRAAKKIRAAFTPRGVSFYDGEWDGTGDGFSHVVATFGANGAQIGKTGSYLLALTGRLIRFLMPDGATVFEAGTVIGGDKVDNYNLGTLSSLPTTYTLPQYVTEIRKLEITVSQPPVPVISELTTDNYSTTIIDGFISKITITSLPSGVTTPGRITLDYTAGNDERPYFILGNRNSIYDRRLGDYSATFGQNNAATSFASFAFGKNCTADGECSIACGKASTGGNYSAAIGWDAGTVADYQVALGDRPGMSTEDAFAIGNTHHVLSDTDIELGFASNALTLDWNGNLKVSGGVSVEKDRTSSMFIAQRTDTGTDARFGVGSSGTNHGVYSQSPLDKWLLHSNGTDVFLNGKNVSSVAANRIFASPNGSTGEASFRALVANDIPSLQNLNGTLSVAKGGTGQTSANAAARALGMAKTAGDTINMSGYVVTGYLTSSKTKMTLTVATPFRFYGFTGATATATATIRQNNLYLFGSTSSASATLSNLEVTAKANGFFTISYTGSTQTNAINNDPVAEGW